MRRAFLLAAAAAVPALAAAQTSIPTGKVQFVEPGTTNDTTRGQYVGLADCQTANATVQLQWSTQLTATNLSQFPPDGKYQITAANKDVAAASGTTTVTCPTTTDANIQATTIGTAITGKTGVVTGVTQPLAPFLAIVGQGACPTGADVTIYVCVQALDAANANIGYAKGTLIYSTAAPDAPPKVTAGPISTGKLSVSWDQPSAGTAAYDYVITAKSVTTEGDLTTRDSRDTVVHTYTSDPNASQMTIGGLTDDVKYAVLVAARSNAGNKSADAGPAYATPKPVNDFWDQYRLTPGAVEQGGCASAGAGPLALAGLAALAGALRRRK